MNKITVISSCRNRKIDAQNCIEFVKKINNLHEHILIDFSSTIPIDINKSNEITKIIRVENENEWSITRSYNLGIFLSKTEYTLKLDVDTELELNKFNKLEFSDYDIVYFQKNQNDLGNFIAKTNVLKSVNGFNEFISNRFDDHDLYRRIKDKDFKIMKVDDIIIKKNHSDEIRVNTIQNKLSKKSPDKYYYAVVKATNDAGAYISKLNLWNNQIRTSYKKLANGNFQIEHPVFHNNLKLINSVILKKIFLKTFFKVFYVNENNFTIKLFKNFLPTLLILVPKTVIKKFYGFNITS